MVSSLVHLFFLAHRHVADVAVVPLSTTTSSFTRGVDRVGDGQIEVGSLGSCALQIRRIAPIKRGSLLLFLCNCLQLLLVGLYSLLQLPLYLKLNSPLSFLLKL